MRNDIGALAGTVPYRLCDRLDEHWSPRGCNGPRKSLNADARTVLATALVKPTRHRSSRVNCIVRLQASRVSLAPHLHAIERMPLRSARHVSCSPEPRAVVGASMQCAAFLTSGPRLPWAVLSRAAMGTGGEATGDHVLAGRTDKTECRHGEQEGADAESRELRGSVGRSDATDRGSAVWIRRRSHGDR
jgi:hypothetical protein